MLVLHALKNTPKNKEKLKLDKRISRAPNYEKLKIKTFIESNL